MAGRHLAEDIVDTPGRPSLLDFLPQLRHQQPASLRIVALLRQAGSHRFPILFDYLGFSIPNKFVVGYGLDYDS